MKKLIPPLVSALILSALLAGAYFYVPTHTECPPPIVGVEPPQQGPDTSYRPPNKAYFVPNYTGDKANDVTKVIVAELTKAKKQVLVQAYEFTSQEIANGLLAAKERKVDVEVIIDRKASESPFCVMKTLLKGGVTCYTDNVHRISHNKIIVIDDTTVITGSFNFTKAAQNTNAENIVILHEPWLIQSYTDNWNEHKGHSKQVN